ncbi:MAG: uroporphyrinogen-III synthase, partial [Nakamurella sp.]
MTLPSITPPSGTPPFATLPSAARPSATLPSAARPSATPPSAAQPSVTLPLQGLRVLVSRPAERSAALIAMLRSAGALPLPVPLISTVPVRGSAQALHAVHELSAGTFDWVAFTSAAAVDAVVAINRDNLAEAGIIAPSTHVAAVGHGTAAALAAAGCTVDLVPSGAQSGAALADSWP